MQGIGMCSNLAYMPESRRSLRSNTIVRSIVRVTSVLVSAASLWAQVQGAGPSSTTSSGSGSRSTKAGAAGTGSTTASPTGSADRTREQRTASPRQSTYRRGPVQPIYIHGRVVMEDGKPPPERLVVRMDCGAMATRLLPPGGGAASQLAGSSPQDVTDEKGRFSFYPDNLSNPRVVDSSQSVLSPLIPVTGSQGPEPQIGFRVQNLSHCVLLVDLPGYRSDRLRLRDFRGMGALNVGPLVLHRLDDFKGSAFSPTTLDAPKAAMEAYRSGLEAQLQKDRKYRKAARQLERAVKLYSRFAAAWWALGEARSRLGDASGARLAYERSIGADPNYLPPYEPLIESAFEHNDWPAVASFAERYMALSPASPEVRYRAAVAAINQGRNVAAERIAADMLSRSEATDRPRVHLILGLAYENRAEFTRAAESYRAFIQAAPHSPLASTAKAKLAELRAHESVQP